MEDLQIISSDELERTKVNGEMISQLNGRELEHLATEQINFYSYTMFDCGRDTKIRQKAPCDAEVAATHPSLNLDGNQYAAQIDYYKYK